MLKISRVRKSQRKQGILSLREWIKSSLVGRGEALLLNKVHLTVGEQQAVAMRGKDAGLFFDWGPDARRYHAHLDERPKLPIEMPSNEPN